MCLQFGFVILWQKAFGAKAALKTLVKLTPGLLPAKVRLEIMLSDTNFRLEGMWLMDKNALPYQASQTSHN